MRRITLVKKVLADGSPCRKCRAVETRMVKNGHDVWIDRVLVADERDPESVGWQLAQDHGVTTAPFFVVEENGLTRVYTVYLKFVREALHSGSSELTVLARTLELNVIGEPA